MKKLNYLGIGPKIAIIALPYLAVSIALTILFPGIFTFGPNVRIPFLVAGLILLVPGLVFYGMTAKSLINGLRSTKLITSGTYRYCQNPLYAVLILMIFPAVGMIGNSWIIITTSIIAYFVFKHSIRKEYEEMESFFGDEYRRYKEVTPEFFPFPK